MKQTTYIIITLLLLFNIYGCNRSKDQDGNSFKTVKIGDQVWMAENLNVEHYRNGDQIPQAKDNSQWSNLKTGAWCYYNNDSTNGEKYAKLYNWYAVIDPRGLAPEDWHIASNDEWKKLNDYLGGYEVSGDKLKEKNSWQILKTEETNNSGFGAYASGHRYGNGEYFDIGSTCFFWTSTKNDDNSAFVYYLQNSNPLLHDGKCWKGMGLSVRCVKDKSK